jgi:hypothetical protein
MEFFGMNSDRNYSVFSKKKNNRNLGNNLIILTGIHSVQFHNTYSTPLFFRRLPVLNFRRLIMRFLHHGIRALAMSGETLGLRDARESINFPLRLKLLNLRRLPVFKLPNNKRVLQKNRFF